MRGVYRASRDVETTYVLLRTFGVKSVNAVVPPKEVADKREAVSAELANLICFVLERNSFGKYVISNKRITCVPFEEHFS